MDITSLNKQLKNVKTDDQLNFLMLRTKKYQLTGVIHGHVVETLLIEKGYAKYTYIDSNIKGRCRIEKLHMYLKF